LTPGDLLAELSGRGITLEPQGDKIKYRAPVGALTPELKEAVSNHKTALLQLLTAPPADAMSEEPCPACGTRERWLWIDGRLLCRVCLVWDLAPLTLVREGWARPSAHQEEVA
jgi:hypothetical protein